MCARSSESITDANGNNGEEAPVGAEIAVQVAADYFYIVVEADVRGDRRAAILVTDVSTHADAGNGRTLVRRAYLEGDREALVVIARDQIAPADGEQRSNLVHRDISGAAERVGGVGRVMRSIDGDGFVRVERDAGGCLGEIGHEHAEAHVEAAGHRKPIDHRLSGCETEVSVDGIAVRGMKRAAVPEIADAGAEIPVRSVRHSYLRTDSGRACRETSAKVAEGHPHASGGGDLGVGEGRSEQQDHQPTDDAV
jgi:hypothetical protein